MLRYDRELICDTLLSGRFQKCRNFLRDGDSRDVFGVFCELFPHPDWEWQKFDDTEGQILSGVYAYVNKKGKERHIAGLPKHLQERLELDDNDMLLLVALNDGHGDWHERPQSFAAMAYWIDNKF